MYMYIVESLQLSVSCVADVFHKSYSMQMKI